MSLKISKSINENLLEAFGIPYGGKPNEFQNALTLGFDIGQGYTYHHAHLAKDAITNAQSTADFWTSSKEIYASGISVPFGLGIEKVYVDSLQARVYNNDTIAHTLNMRIYIDTNIQGSDTIFLAWSSTGNNINAGATFYGNDVIQQSFYTNGFAANVSNPPSVNKMYLEFDFSEAISTNTPTFFYQLHCKYQRKFAL